LVDGSRGERIGLSKTPPGRQLDFFSRRRTSSRSSHRYASATHCEFSGRRAGTVGAALGVVRIARPAQFHAILLEHGLKYSHPGADHQVMQNLVHAPRNRQNQLLRSLLANDPLLGILLHGGSPLRNPENPLGAS